MKARIMWTTNKPHKIVLLSHSLTDYVIRHSTNGSKQIVGEAEKTKLNVGLIKRYVISILITFAIVFLLQYSKLYGLPIPMDLYN